MTGLRSMVAALLLAPFLMMAGAAGAFAAEDALPPEDLNWSFEGPFGTFDRGALQRGLQVYIEVCSACHAVDYLHYRNLGDLGYTEDEIKALAAQFTVTDGPNDEGEMFDRPARPSDPFVRPYPNDEAARALNNGALPVDLSTVIKARMNGADYVHALLNGYQEAPEDVDLLEGLYYNPYFPGGQIAMAPPLSDGIVEYADGTEATTDQMGRDVVTFLAWAAEPETEMRKRLGIKVLLFLILFTGLLYAAKRKIWSRLHK